MRRAVRRVAERYGASLTRYAIGPGHNVLRRAIARYALGLGCQLDSRDIVITDSCLESITLCLRSVTQPGDVVALESPTLAGMKPETSSRGSAVPVRCSRLEDEVHARCGLPRVRHPAT